MSKKVKVSKKVKIFKKVKISQKLIANSIFSAIVLLIVAGVGILSTKAINDDSRFIYENSLTKLKYIYTLQSDSFKEKLDLEHLLNEDFAMDTEAMTTELTSIEAQAETLFAEYEKLPFANEEAKSSFEEFRALFPEYRASIDNIVAFVTAGDYEAATTEFL